MPGGLLYSDGDSVTLTWSPSDVLPSEIASQDDYQVIVEVYAYVSNEWELFQLVSIQGNTGSATVQIRSGPEESDPIVPISFHIKAGDSGNLEEYIRPIVRDGQVGIWSPVAYKITDPTYVAADFCEEFVENQNISGTDLLQNTAPCPCRADQARVGNSMSVEQRSSTAVQMRQFFYPGAATCFLSTELG